MRSSHFFFFIFVQNTDPTQISFMENIKFIIETFLNASTKKYSAACLQEKLSFDTGDNAYTLKRILMHYKMQVYIYRVQGKENLQKFIEHISLPILNTTKGWVLIKEYHYQQASGEMVVNYIAEGISEEVTLSTFYQIFLETFIGVDQDGFEDPATEEHIQADRQNKGISYLKFAGIATIFFAIVMFHENMAFSTLFLLSIIGTYTSYMLIAQEYGSLPALIANICSPQKNIAEEDVAKNSKEGKESVLSCQAVSESKASKFTISGLQIRISDLSSIFFFFQVLLMGFSYFSVGQKMFEYALYFQALTIPIPIVSLATQMRMNKYCTLCLIISGVLLLQIGISALYFFLALKGQIINPEERDIMLIGMLLLVATLLVIFIRRSFKHENLMRKYQRLYALLLTKKENVYGHLKLKPELSSSLRYSLNNVYQAGKTFEYKPYEMLFITNPFCTPCAKFHHTLGEVKHMIDVGYFFVYFDETGREIAKHFIALSLLNKDHEFFHKVLKKWYEAVEKKEMKANDLEKSLQYFREISGVYELPEALLTQSSKILADQWEWIHSYSKEGTTPTILINGVEVPSSLFSIMPYVMNQIEKKPQPNI